LVVFVEAFESYVEGLLDGVGVYYLGAGAAGEDGRLMLEKWGKLVETFGEQIPMNGTSFVIDIVTAGHIASNE
jgi:hypothetical protein